MGSGCFQAVVGYHFIYWTGSLKLSSYCTALTYCDRHLDVPKVQVCTLRENAHCENLFTHWSGQPRDGENDSDTVR